jgi:predicted permease
LQALALVNIRLATRLPVLIEVINGAFQPMSILSLLTDLARDLRHTLRSFRYKPLFAVVCVLTLALGIGVNAGIYTVLNAALLRALPVANPTQLMLPMVKHDFVPYPLFSLPYLTQVSAALPPSASMAVMTPENSLSLQVGNEPGRDFPAQLVSGNYFSVLGTHAALGRLLTPADDQGEGGGPVGVISYDYWTTQFARSPSVLGSTIEVNKSPITIVGVAPRGFFGTRVGFTPAIWLPIHMQSAVRYSGMSAHENSNDSQPWSPQNGIRWLQAVVRVGDPSTTPRIAGVFNTLMQEDAKNRLATVDAVTRRVILEERVALVPGSRGFQELQSKFSQPLYLLMGMAGVLLLIACANIANLMLARASGRQREISLRISIGASRARIVRQTLTESLVLAFLGGLVGIAVAYAVAHELPRWASGSSTPLPLDLSPDWRVLGFGLLLCLVTGVLFGLGPALQTTRAQPAMLMRGGSRSIVGGENSRWSPGKLLVAGQVALSLCLLVAAGLFLRTMQNYSRLNLGFDRDHLLAVRVNTHAAGIPQDQLPAFTRRVLDAVQSTPGVLSAGVASASIDSGSSSTSGITLSTADSAATQDLNVETARVTPAYFNTLGLSLLRGRAFTQADSNDNGHTTPSVVIVNQKFAGKSDPLTARLKDERGQPAQIIGVIANARTQDVRQQPQPTYYTPQFQQNGDFNEVLLRVSGSPHAFDATIRTSLAGLGLPVSRISTIDERIDQSLSQQDAVSRLTTFLSLLALVLASLGLYGVMTYNVARRTSEIGVRLALGSARTAMLWLIFRESLLVVIAGIAIGVCAAFGTAQLASNLLFGLTPHDPATFTLSALVLLLVGSVAASIPAWRASRVDPMEALRIE